MIYAKINDAGHIEYTVESTQVQPGLVELDYSIGQSPGNWYAFNVNTKTWEDTSSGSQKYDDAVQATAQKRSTLLTASDWTQLPDVPLTTKESWAVYRQALRDVTLQSEYPLNVVWPTPPQ